jgi:Dolichyl-phosphate-mannose-protein mannosyltransferase
VVGLGRGTDRLTLLGQAHRQVRRHWLFAVLLAMAAVLRAVVYVAYHPALIFPDSVRYLQYAHSFANGHWSVDELRQSGYSVLIIPAVLVHDLWIIPLVQHLVGLATAVLVYAVLVHFGIRAWIAALATIPVLFDPLQLIGEQFVLTDVWTVFLIVAALVILVWNTPDQRGAGGRTGEGLSWRRAAWCGLLLGLAVTFRDEELIMIIPAAVFVAVAVRPGKRLAQRMAALIGCFLIPVAAYLGWFEASHSELGFTTFSGAFLYGRVADFASCQGLSLPSYEKPLCPTQPPALRSADFYTWAPQSPQWTFRPPPGMSRDAVVRDFSLRILRHQPLAYAEAVGWDFVYGFSPVRGAGPEHYPRPYLQFHRYILPDPQADASLAVLGFKAPAVRSGPAAFLTGYGRWFYVPGPVFAAGLVVAVAGLAVATRRRDTPTATRDACLLFALSAVLVLIPPAVFATFDWRYQLPQLSLIPIAAALGAAILGNGRLTAVRTPTGGTARQTRPASAESDLRAPNAR